MTAYRRMAIGLRREFGARSLAVAELQADTAMMEGANAIASSWLIICHLLRSGGPPLDIGLGYLPISPSAVAPL